MTLLPALPAFSSVAAQDTPPDQESVTAQVKAIAEEFEQARHEFLKKCSVANPEERAALLKKESSPSNHAAKMLSLAKDNPDDSGTFNALIWITLRVRAGAEVQEAISILVEKHSTNPRFDAKFCDALSRIPGPSRENCCGP